MSLNLIVRPEAEQDIKEAYVWYEDRMHGLGTQFINAVDETMSLVSTEPEIFQKVYRTLRRALIQRFPYGIFYTIGPGSIVILAVMHTARQPSKWKQRAKA